MKARHTILRPALSDGRAGVARKPFVRTWPNTFATHGMPIPISGIGIHSDPLNSFRRFGMRE